MKTLNILAIGDIVGPQAVEYLGERLWNYRLENNLQLVVANGENAALGNGLDTKTAKYLLENGVDVLTTGNHVWHKRDLRPFLDDSSYIVRPANFPSQTPGKGYTKIDVDGFIFLIINVLGVIYMDSLDSPFLCIEKILKSQAGTYDFAILDVHAEATSEKIALGFYFDGQISVIFGTHTHVTTADEKILPLGTGYITDLGMSGPTDSILGIRKDCIIEKLTLKMPVKFDVAEGEIVINGTIFGLNTQNKKVETIERIKF